MMDHLTLCLGRGFGPQAVDLGHLGVRKSGTSACHRNFTVVTCCKLPRLGRDLEPVCDLDQSDECRLDIVGMGYEWFAEGCV
ncbi:MAG TPA: hypothetical protein VFP68_23295 [Burkholderiaceae bacterium]|nr:hypothetical protein [Burkholderiaceae bacterium]